MTSHHSYPTRTLAGDYALASVGAAFMLGPLALLEVAPLMVYILGGLGTLFVVFGVRTVLRHMTRVKVSTEEIRLEGPLRVALRWQNLNTMKLSYYSTHRDRHGGWMELKLKDTERTIKLVSAIDGFPTIVRQAAAAARANRVSLDEPTVENLGVLGIAPDGPEESDS